VDFIYLFCSASPRRRADVVLNDVFLPSLSLFPDGRPGLPTSTKGALAPPNGRLVFFTIGFGLFPPRKVPRDRLEQVRPTGVSVLYSRRFSLLAKRFPGRDPPRPHSLFLKSAVGCSGPVWPVGANPHASCFSTGPAIRGASSAMAFLICLLPPSLFVYQGGF